MSPEDISKNMGGSISYFGINPNGTLNPTSTANAPGHWYSNSGQTISWGNGAYIFSELNISNLIANVGQYPGRCKDGDQFTIKQGLKYTKSATESAQVTLIFNIRIQEEVVAGLLDQTDAQLKIYPNPTAGMIRWNYKQDWVLMDATGSELARGNDSFLDLSEYAIGLYFVKVGNQTSRIIKE